MPKVFLISRKDRYPCPSVQDIPERGCFSRDGRRVEREDEEDEEDEYIDVCNDDTLSSNCLDLSCGQAVSAKMTSATTIYSDEEETRSQSNSVEGILPKEVNSNPYLIGQEHIEDDCWTLIRKLRHFKPIAKTKEEPVPDTTTPIHQMNGKQVDHNDAKSHSKSIEMINAAATYTISVLKLEHDLRVSSTPTPAAPAVGRSTVDQRLISGSSYPSDYVNPELLRHRYETRCDEIARQRDELEARKNYYNDIRCYLYFQQREEDIRRAHDLANNRDIVASSAVNVENNETLSLNNTTSENSRNSKPEVEYRPLLENSASRYCCRACSKSYATYGGLTKHRQLHCTRMSENSLPREFRCERCEKSYSTVGALKMHVRTHTLPCRCQLCGKAFSRPWLLQGHMRTHTGEKPFRCEHCQRAFADRSNLRAHLQTHSAVKRYRCDQCQKTFSRMSLLLKHKQTSCPHNNL